MKSKPTKPLLNNPCVTEHKYNNDPKALCHLYDQAFSYGVWATLEFIYSGGDKKVLKEMFNDICEAMR